MSKPRPSDEAVDALVDAVTYTLNRTQTDPDFYYQCGWGTETFRRLVKAESLVTGEPFEVVEKRRTKDLQPEHRKREPEVLELRKRLENCSCS